MKEGLTSGDSTPRRPKTRSWLLRRGLAQLRLLLGLLLLLLTSEEGSPKKTLLLLRLLLLSLTHSTK